jgi:phosphoglycolate phosphatase
MKKKYELIIFDLDGTLLDTSLGIFNSVRYTEAQMGFLPIPQKQLTEFVGPPPKLSYIKAYGVDELTALKAVGLHREYGKMKGVYEAELYPQIMEVLRRLIESGYKLAVATLKQQNIAEAILGNFKLKEYFNTIVGMDQEETLTKSMTIQLAIKNTDTKGNVLMVGDSVYDSEGAWEAGVDFLGVLYGFGFDNLCEQHGYIKEPIQIFEYLE